MRHGALFLPLLLVAHPLQDAADHSAPEHGEAPQVSQAAAEVGHPAPAFELALASDPEQRLPLAAWLDGRALALVFASSTAPSLGAAAGRLGELALAYGEEVQFLLVYLREAPALEPPDPPTLAERAARCARLAAELGLPFPALVDELDDRVGRAYSADPERLFLIAPDGRVAFAGEPGLDADALELAILELLTGTAAPEPAPAARSAGAGLLAALDADGDGTLSPPEIDAASAVLRSFDLDGDGRLIPAELRRAAAHEAPPPAAPPADEALRSSPESAPESTQPPEREPPGERSIGSFDYDGDGRLSRIEVPRAMLERWETFDRNGDGYLDSAEQAPLTERHREQRDG